MIILQVDNSSDFNVQMSLKTLEATSVDVIKNFIVVNDSYLTYGSSSAKQNIIINYSQLDTVNINE